MNQRAQLFLPVVILLLFIIGALVFLVFAKTSNLLVYLGFGVLAVFLITFLVNKGVVGKK